MEQSFVKNLGRRRYRLLLVQTVTFFVWFSLLLAIWWAPVSYWIVILLVPMLVGCVVFCIASLQLGKIAKQIDSDHHLRLELNNEQYRADSRKAIVWGYYVVLCAITVMFVISMFVDIPGKVVAGILLLVGVSGAQVAQLVFYRMGSVVAERRPGEQ